MLACKRRGQVERFARVPGQFGRTAVGRPVERTGERRMQPHPLARQQVVIDRLGQQGVPEPVARARADSSRWASIASRSATSSRASSRSDTAASRSCTTARPATAAVRTTWRASSESRSTRTSSRSASWAGSWSGSAECADAASSSSAKNALPSARSMILTSARLRHRLGARRPQQRRHLVPIEDGQRERFDVRLADPFGRRRPQRVPAVDVVAAVRGDDRDPLRAQPGEQEAEQVAGGLIGPVDVFEQQQDGLQLGDRGERVENRFEQRRLLDAVVTANRSVVAAARGQQPGDGRVVGADRFGQAGCSAARRPNTSLNGR